MNVAISELGTEKLPLINTGTSIQVRITESLAEEFTPESQEQKKTITVENPQ